MAPQCRLIFKEITEEIIVKPLISYDKSKEETTRLGDEERGLMHLVPAAAVKPMKRRVLSRPGVDSVLFFPYFL